MDELDHDPWLVVGTIVGPQGIKGEVRVHSCSDFPERFEVPGVRWIRPSPAHPPQPIELLQGYPHGGKRNIYIVRFRGIDTCEQAEELRNYALLVSHTDRPHLAKGEFYVADLIGCAVTNQDNGEPIGVVTAVIPAGNDLLEVTNSEGAILLIPFVEPIVPEVDLINQHIAVTPVPGLLDNFN